MVTHNKTIQYTVYARAELPQRHQEIVTLAEQMTAQSYAPYSQFHVGCALRFTDNTYFKGNNQENAVYPGGMCAERVTLFAASAINPDKPISQIAVMARRLESNHLVHCAPCGMCMQAMLEYELKQSAPIELIFMGVQDQYYVVPSVASCLPFSFSHKNLDA